MSTDPTNQGAVGEWWYYFCQDEKAHGPFVISDLCECAESGELRADALVCRAGEEHWSRIEDHDFLSGVLSEPIRKAKDRGELRSLMNAVLTGDGNEREITIQRLSGIKVVYRHPQERPDPTAGETAAFVQSTDEWLGPTTLWQVLDFIEAGLMPIDTQVCQTGTELWLDAVRLCATALKRS